MTLHYDTDIFYFLVRLRMLLNVAFFEAIKSSPEWSSTYLYTADKSPNCAAIQSFSARIYDPVVEEYPVINNDSKENYIFYVNLKSGR